MSVKPLRERQAEATRALAGLYCPRTIHRIGYAGTSIEDIIQRAGVAKGALYHHFDGKRALFQAVYDEVLAEAANAAVDAAADSDEPWSAVRAGLGTFLDACLDPTFRRVVIMDSVVVIQSDHGEELENVELPMLRTVLAPLFAIGTLSGINIEPLAHVALGGLYGAALYIARSAEPVAARAEAEVVLETLVSGLRASLDQTD